MDDSIASLLEIAGKRIEWLERENARLNCFIQSMQEDNKRLLAKVYAFRYDSEVLEKENADLKQQLARINWRLKEATITHPAGEYKENPIELSARLSYEANK